MKTFIHFIIGLLVVISHATFAQLSLLDGAKSTQGGSYLSAGLRYKSDYFYMGRSDSAKAPYLIPSIGYYHKSGLFISSSFSYLLAQDNQRIDLYTVSAGYDYTRKNFAAGVALDEYFFSDDSYVVQAEMNTYLSGYLGYDLRAFMVMVDASLGFSESTDVFLNAELSRNFYLLHRKLLITPAINAKWGTQYYYSEYYTERSVTTGTDQGGGGKGKGNGTGSQTGTTTTTTVIDIQTSDSEKFQVLDYETSLQATYKFDPFRVSVGATWMFPVNPSMVTIDEVTYEEELETGFLFTARLTYYLRFKKK